MGSEKFNRFKQGSGSGLDQIVYLNQTECFKGSSVVAHNVFDNLPDPENQLVNSSSHLLHYPSDSNLVDMMVPKVPIFGNESFLELVNCFPRPDSSQIRVASCYTNYVNDNGVATDSQEYCQISEEGAMKVSTNGKRKFSSGSHSNTNKNVGGEHPKATSVDTSECSKEQHGKKQKTELNNSPNLKSKQVKDDSSGEEPPKENYVHMRAKRGQATNNHSLAERVRREKISERMKLLQELVPGCNKITGKALMLDEIINYVQSLQQQVEFLSMKLATVNPELNFDIEQILSKDILHSQRSNAALLGLGPGSSSPHPFSGISHGTFNGTSGATPLLHQYVMDNELQSLLHMGFDSNSFMINMGPNGRSNLEL